MEEKEVVIIENNKEIINIESDIRANELENEKIDSHAFIKNLMDIKKEVEIKDEDLTDNFKPIPEMRECMYCKKEFSKDVKNIRTYTRKKPYQCTYCENGYFKEDEYEQHMRTHPEDKPYFCTYCNEKFPLKAYLDEHICEKYACSQCEKQICKICNNIKTPKYAFVYDSAQRATECNYICLTCEKHKCSICDRLFAIEDELKVHMHTHTGRKSYECVYCCIVITDSESLENHVKTHKKEASRLCSCRDCRKGSSKNIAKRAESVTCPKCQKIFHDETCFKKHTITECGTRFECPICSKVYNAKMKLTHHTNMKHKKKNFICTMCKKSFVYRFHLDQHIVLHKKKKVQCKLCDKWYKSPIYLERHMLRKHNEVPHKTFSSSKGQQLGDEGRIVPKQE